MKIYTYKEQELRNAIIEARIMRGQEITRDYAQEVISVNAILDETNENNDYDKEVNKMIDELDLEKRIDFIKDEWIYPYSPDDSDLITATNKYTYKAMECLDNSEIFQVGNKEDLIEYFIENCLTEEQKEFLSLYEDAVNYDEMVDLGYFYEEITYEKVNDNYYIIKV